MHKKLILYFYVKESITNVKKHMKDEKMEFHKKISNVIYWTKNKFYAVEYRYELESLAKYRED